MHVLGLQSDIEKILSGFVCCIRVANEGIYRIKSDFKKIQIS